MSRDMKSSRNNSRSSSAPKSGGSSMLTGLLVGLFVGIAIAIAVALFLNARGNPFAKDQTVPSDALASGPETTTSGPEILQPGNGKDAVPVITTPPKASAASAVAKPESANASEDRFDFYKVLPEAGEKGPAATPTSKPKPSSSPVPDASKPGLLQVGAFQNENDADNLKAKLALIGIESRIQTTEVADKGVWHRVRVGPFHDQSELERIRAVLKTNGIDSTIVKVN